jgi:hypothetical protein
MNIEPYRGSDHSLDMSFSRDERKPRSQHALTLLTRVAHRRPEQTALLARALAGAGWLDTLAAVAIGVGRERSDRPSVGRGPVHAE